MFKQYKIILFLVIFLFFLALPSLCFAQRRHRNNRRYNLIEEIKNKSPEKRTRTYDMVLEFGLGNFSYDISGGNGTYGGRSIYIGDMVSMKPILRVIEKKGTWTIEISGEIFGTTYKLERWWSKQQLFRINKLMAKGLCIETLIRYHFEETALYPFPVLAQSNIGLGFIYRFQGLRRKDVLKLIDITNEPLLSKETDFALFGIEPNLGFNFKMDDGRIIGYLDIGTGIYGASVESNYESAGFSTSPESTYGRSILGRIGIRGKRERFNYQIGYSVFRLKIKAKDTIPESRTKLDKIICNIGIMF